ncbi:hypothetical protein DEA8626_01427 [Defluviimonas aquaemixtae]|uniref:Uncharacterized protein n=1 Tax=Albidovulum aquaemixtae TaxID=1542388 RepID=A0A2R8B5K1_9RHOB|nr:hypothetical protein DEA8626_01427 [Defluviimonas aquaemixtae]
MGYQDRFVLITGWSRFVLAFATFAHDRICHHLHLDPRKAVIAMNADLWRMKPAFANGVFKPNQHVYSGATLGIAEVVIETD